MRELKLAPSTREELVAIQFGSLEPMMLSVMVPTTVMGVDPVIGILDENNDVFSHLHSIKERGKVERRTLDTLRERRDLVPVRSMKPDWSIFLNKNLLCLSH